MRKRRRARDRQASHLKRLRATVGGTGILEVESVQNATRRSYWNLLERFLDFAARFGLRVDSHPLLDAALVDFSDDAFLDGENVDFGEKLQAALEAMLPSFQRHGKLQLPRFKRALKGWRRLAPNRSRLPMPEEHMHAMVGALCAAGHAEMGLWTRMVFSAYLRPGEGRQLMTADVVEPTGSS